MNEIEPAYFNEHDPPNVQWLRNLADAGLIPGGVFDGRDIQEVRPDDVRKFLVCHWFAGVGGWALALELAGWDPRRPVWTASLPCQPFSAAGKRKGEADSRHLWPFFRSLVAECRPATIFGEQVSSPDGRLWLTRVRADLEDLGYRVGAADLCAAGAGEKAEGRIRRGDQISYETTVVGAPHIRQRLYWVADAVRQRTDTRRVGGIENGEGKRWDQSASSGSTRRLAEPGQQSPRDASAREGVGENSEPSERRSETIGESGRRGGAGGMEHAEGDRRHERRAEPDGRGVAGGCGVSGLGDSRRTGLAGRQGEPGDDGSQLSPSERTGGNAGPWSRFDLVDCLDGKTRRVEPGSQCLVDGVPFRLVDGCTLEGVSRPTLLKGFGNAIVPWLAAEFIAAFLDIEKGMESDA